MCERGTTDRFRVVPSSAFEVVASDGMLKTESRRNVGREQTQPLQEGGGFPFKLSKLLASTVGLLPIHENLSIRDRFRGTSARRPGRAWRLGC